MKKVISMALALFLCVGLCACCLLESGEMIAEGEKVTGEENADLNGHWGAITVADYKPGTDSFLIGWRGEEANTRVYYSSNYLGDTKMFSSSDGNTTVNISFHDTQVILAVLYNDPETSSYVDWTVREDIPYESMNVSDASIKLMTTEGLTMDDVDLAGDWYAASGIMGIQIDSYAPERMYVRWYDTGSRWSERQLYTPSTAPKYYGSGDSWNWYKNTIDSQFYLGVKFNEQSVTLYIIEANMNTTHMVCAKPIKDVLK